MSNKGNVCITFDELTSDQKDILIDNNRYINVNNDSWYEPIIEDLGYMLSLFGLSDIDIPFDGCDSQNDGSNFTCKFHKDNFLTISEHQYFYKTHPELRYIIDIYNSLCEYEGVFMGRIERVDGIHRNQARVIVDHGLCEGCDCYIKLEGDIKCIIKELSNHCYEKLRNNYNYLISDEAIEEFIINGGSPEI